MKEIDEFVNNIFNNFDNKETSDLKEEIQSHLIEAVTELKSEGKTENEAIIMRLIDLVAKSKW